MGLCFPHLKDLIRHSCTLLGITHAVRLQDMEPGVTRRLSMTQNSDLPHVMHVGKEFEGMRMIFRDRRPKAPERIKYQTISYNK